MRTILVPVDFSANAENALRYAIEFKKRFNSKIILIHSYETPVLYGEMSAVALQMDQGSLRDNAEEKLKALYKQYFTKEDNAEMILKQGLASARVCEIALEKGADMIIMGTTGTGRAERLLIGSNALRVAQNAHCKVMLIPSKTKFNAFEKIVYATDLNDDNLIQARELFPIAKKFNSELMFLYVDGSLNNLNETKIRNKVTRKIKNLVSFGKKSGYVCNDFSTADGVEYFLNKHIPDCIAVYHRHRNFLKSIYKQSLSKRIALHARIPVMILHSDDFTEEI